MGRLLSSSFISPSLSLSLRSMSTAAYASAPPPPPELQKFEADLAERLEHLSLATNPPNLNWTSDAMAVLLSTHASATTTIFPTLRSLPFLLLHHHHPHDSSAAAAANARHMIGEYLDRCVGLLDVCNALKTATCQLEEHLGQLDHALARAGQACSNATANGAALLMQAAGRRLGSCLPPPAPPAPPPPAQAQAQAHADRPRAMMTMRRSTSQPSLTEARSNRGSSLALLWQQTLAEAQLSLHQLKKRITTSPPSYCSSSSDDACSLLPIPLLLQSLNAITLTAALLLSALTSTLMGLSSNGGASSNDAWWSRSGLILMASSHRQRRRHCCVMVSPSSVSNLGGRECRWALPLQEIQRHLVAAHELTNGGGGGGGGQLDEVYVLGRTACVALGQSHKHHDEEDGAAALLLVKLRIGNLAKEVGEMRESIAGLRVQTGLLCQAMAAVRAGLLDASSSSSSSSFPI